MCGRTACTLAPDIICRACGRQGPDGKYSQPQWIDGPKGHSYFPSYNLAPTTFSPVLFSKKHLPADKPPAKEDTSSTSCDWVIQPMRWGLIPSWHRGEPASIEYKMNNARSDGLLSKASFKKPLERGNRCVVLADGYFEWQRRADGSKQPYFIYFPQSDLGVDGGKAVNEVKVKEENDVKVKDEVNVGGGNVDEKVKVEVKSDDKGIAVEIKSEETGNTKVMPEKRLLTMAGLFDVWKPDEAAEPLYSYTVITVDAHNKLSWMHDRMPAILNGEDEIDAWLNYEDVKLTEALKLIRPTDSVVYHPVSSAVNNSRNNSADCVKHFQSDAAEQKKPSASANLMKSWLSSAAKRPASDDGSSVDKKTKI